MSNSRVSGPGLPSVIHAIKRSMQLIFYDPQAGGLLLFVVSQKVNKKDHDVLNALRLAASFERTPGEVVFFVLPVGTLRLGW
jgi:hypothetical protein